MRATHQQLRNCLSCNSLPNRGGGIRTPDLLLPKRTLKVTNPVEMPEFPEKARLSAGMVFLTSASKRTPTDT